MESKLNELVALVKDKKVFLATHWDADGISSGALIYHLLKQHVKEIKTISKGDVFQVKKEDLGEDIKYDVIICTDIQPGYDLNPEKVIYIDHHPHSSPEMFLYSIHDSDEVSTSLLIWKELIKETKDPYFVFLVLLGYFGDNGSKTEIPKQLFENAKLLIPELMVKRKSYYGKEDYFEIQKHLSLINVGKRMHWNGEVPFALLKDLDSPKQFIGGNNPLFIELTRFKTELRKAYSMKIEIKDIGNLHYSIIESPMNIQGVLCARHMKDKPIMIINKYNGSAIASMRVPDELDFDAGAYLDKFNEKVKSLVGGGHEKAGGVTMASNELNLFLELMEENER